MELKTLPVAIIGAGPVGLAAAAHLAKRGENFILIEKGSQVGSNLLNWGHVRVFSHWKYNIDKVAKDLLKDTDWQEPNEDELPNGNELVEHYLKPLSQHALIKARIITDAEVMSITRRGIDKMRSKDREKLPFEIHVKTKNAQQVVEARAVIDASGTWQNHNPLGSGGVFALGEKENSHRISYDIPDVTGSKMEKYKNKNVLVAGGGHSAINSILELSELKELYPQTQLHWVLRKTKLAEIYGGQENDALPARGELGIKIEQLIKNELLSVYSPFHIRQIEADGDKLNIIGLQQGTEKMLKGIDEIISNTGTRPDLSFLREVRVEVDSSIESVPALAELIDPNIHSCGTVRAHGEHELRQKEKDFYIVGMKSYGRAPTFLMATGFEQVRSVVAALCGDWEAARKAELDLPETGVCSTGLGNDDACCSAKLPAQKAHKTCC